MPQLHNEALADLNQKIQSRLERFYARQYSEKQAFASAIAAELLTARLTYAVGLERNAAPSKLCIAQCAAAECEKQLATVLAYGDLAHRWTGHVEVDMEFFLSPCPDE